LAIRAALATPPVLKLFDASLPSKVTADASNVAVGGVLLQEHGTVWHPVACYSRKLSPTEQHKTTRERECLEVKQCLVEWRHYLLGAPFTVLSDHKSLKWLQTQGVSTLSDRLLCWLEYFSLYDFQQEYFPGDDNVLPDNLSRPSTEVLVVTTSGSAAVWDLWTLAVRLDDCQHILPAGPCCFPVLADTLLQTYLLARIREAQERDPVTADIKNKLANPKGAPPGTRAHIVPASCRVVGSTEPDGRQRLVVPSPSLQLDICRHAHDESGHQRVHSTVHVIATFFYWPNMQKAIRTYVAFCSVCQAAKPSKNLPAGHSEPVSLLVEYGADWTIDFIDLPESANKYSRLLVLSDRVSKVVSGAGRPYAYSHRS
jgi:hypothetical protein